MYPHYLVKNIYREQSLGFHSTNIKGRVFDYIFKKIPHELLNNAEFKKTNFLSVNIRDPQPSRLEGIKDKYFNEPDD